MGLTGSRGEALKTTAKQFADEVVGKIHGLDADAEEKAAVLDIIASTTGGLAAMLRKPSRVANDPPPPPQRTQEDVALDRPGGVDLPEDTGEKSLT